MPLKRLNTHRRGFTLLEILLSTGIFMIIMVVGIAIFTSTINNSSTSEQARINAQSARFAFEAIIREARLSRGLTYTDTQAVTHIVIPPFDFNDDTNPTEVRIYQATKTGVDATTGDTTYTLTRRSYKKDTSDKLMLQTSTDNSPKTAKQFYDIVTAGSKGVDLVDWATLPAVEILPKDRRASQFTIVHKHSYPLPGDSTDSLTVQPFIEIQVTVYNPNYNSTRTVNGRITTTLRTMIVPRNFLSPLQVVQPGVQGASN